MSDPLLFHPQVITTPHIAGVTERSYRGMARILGETIKSLIRGDDIPYCVN